MAMSEDGISGPFVLFTAAAAQSSAFMDFDTFLWSLNANLLLNPSVLVISDPFFTSSFIAEYFERYSEVGESIFERALQDRFIIPFARDNDIVRFDQMIERQPHFGNPSGRHNLQRLSHLNQTQIFWRKHWPEGMGKRFASRTSTRFVARKSRFRLSEQ